MLENLDAYDVLVIGGGISGLGVAQEAVRRGFKTLLLEKGACCAATSNSSMRIIHGGLRYLQSLDLRRMLESIRAKADLLLQYPAFVKSLPCVMPLARIGLKSRWPVLGAIRFYNQLYSCLSPNTFCAARLVDEGFVNREIPALRGLAPFGALMWHDAIVPRSVEFADLLKGQLRESGGEIREHWRVSEVFRGAAGFEVAAEAYGCVYRIPARVVVNASGPWLRHINVNPALRVKSEPRGWTKAFNIILNRQVEPEYAIGVSGGKGRLFFTTPRGDLSVIGTFYYPYMDMPDNLSVSEREIEEALGAYRCAMPRVRISSADIKGIEAGVLPIKRGCPDMPVMYGVERIYDYVGYVEVLSTKYTTFQVQARRVLDKIEIYLR